MGNFTIGRILAIIGSIVAVLSWLFLSSLEDHYEYSSGLGTIDWIIRDINWAIENPGDLELSYLLSEMILVLGMVFLLLGIWKRIFGLIGSLIVMAFMLFALLGILGAIIPESLNPFMLAMAPTDIVVWEIFPIHIEFMNNYGLGAVLTPVGSIVAFVGHMLNKKRKEQ